MDMGDNKDKLDLEKRSKEPLSYQPSCMSTDWSYIGANFASSSMGLVLSENPMAICGDVVGPSCSSSSMVDSFGPTVWEHHPLNSASLGVSEMNVSNGGVFLPRMSGMLPHSLSQFPADSAFIERAARFSSFNGGHFGEILNPFGIHQSPNPYSRGGTMMQGPQEILPGSPVKNMPGGQPQKPEANTTGPSKDVALPPHHAAAGGSPLDNQMTGERSRDDAKRGASMSENDSYEAEFSGGCAQGDGAPSSAKVPGSKKRRRDNNKDAEPEQLNEAEQKSGEVGKNSTEVQQRGDRNLTATGDKTNGKQSSQASDPPKEEYIHVRARRGQATNSHSLAERVRREKISERMKFLQDLVPGCSKVTGKAVMLDEIINYVQSLQRQVEFLSMKLATVNPRLDFNIERLLAKDMFSARTGPSSGLGFSPDMQMPYPPPLPTQPPILQPGFPPIGNSSNVLRRTTHSQLLNIGGGFKEPGPQLPANVWEDELHNVVQMGLNASAPLDTQETNCSLPPGEMKAEP